MLAKGRKQILILSIVMGLAAAGLTGYYLTKVSEAANAVETVVVAKGDIPARTAVTEDMLTVREIPKGARHPEATSTMAPVIGKVTKQSIDAGEQVLMGKFFRERRESGLAFVIPAGRRAVSVGVDERIGAGGMVAAGDRIDIMGICKIPGSESNGVDITKSVFALQNIEVLAVAQKVVGEESVSPVDALKTKSDSSTLSTSRQASQETKARTVTLAVTPKEAQSMALVEENPACNIRLALRSPGDSDLVPLSETVLNPKLSLAEQVR